MLDRIKGIFSGETYSPVTLFEVKNVISGEGKISLPSEKKIVEKVQKESRVVEKVVKAPRTKKKGKSILDIMEQFEGEVNSTEVLAKCLEEKVCSRATFFRKINKLVDEGKLSRSKQGKEVFYSLA